MSVYLNMDANWNEVRIENRILLKKFLNYIALKNRKDRTLRQYNSDIRTFFIWNKLYNDDKDFIKVTTEDFLRFRMWGYKEFKWKASRAYGIEAALSSLSTYIEEELHYDGFKSVIKKIKLKYGGSSIEANKATYTDEQLQDILDMLISEGSYKEACMVAFGMYSGRNYHEMTQYEVSFFDDKNVYAGKLYKTPVPLETAKGNKVYCYILKEKFDPYLKMWMDYRNENGIKSKWLFPPTKGRRVLLETSRKTIKYLDTPIRWGLLAEYASRQFATAGLSYTLLCRISGLTEDALIKAYVGIR